MSRTQAGSTLSPEDLAIHKRCLVRTFLLTSGAGKTLTVNVVDAQTEQEANRCWVTTQHPDGAPEKPTYRADIMIAFIRGTGERWIKGGNYVDLFTKFSDELQGAFFDTVDEQEVDVEWEEDYHTFSDSNVVHWLITNDTDLTLDQIVEFVVDERERILSKAPKTRKTDRDA